MLGFGERIVYLRKEKNLSQKALAEKMNISATRLNYWEKNKREPDLFNLLALCDALDITPDELLNYSKSYILTNEEKKIISEYRKNIKFNKIVNAWFGDNDEK